MNKFFDWYFTGRFLRHPMVVAVILLVKIKESEWEMTEAEELQALVKSFFEDYLDVQEESDSGRVFNPIHISCVRAMKLEPLYKLLMRIRELSRAKESEWEMTEPVNKLMCKLCGDVIESKTRHDFVRCKCKSIYVDGGKDYFRRGGDARNMIDLSVYADDVIKWFLSGLNCSLFTVRGVHVTWTKNKIERFMSH